MGGSQNTRNVECLADCFVTMDAASIAIAIDAACSAYAERFHAIPALTKRAFEQRDWTASLALSRERMTVYSDRAQEVAMRIRVENPDAVQDEALWRDVRDRYVSLIRGRYAADIAYAFMNSVRRMVSKGAWRAVDYSWGQVSGETRPRPEDRITIHCSIPFDHGVTQDAIRAVLAVPSLSVPFRNLEIDAARVARRINDRLGENISGVFEIIDAGFYRNRGAYIVGRIRLADKVIPFGLALLNEDEGVFVDAVLINTDTLRYVFSSSLANFHVTLPHYHELVDFLYGIMPGRPHALHYSTVGFHHTGKIAVMRELSEQLREAAEVFDHAVGPRGTVAIGFSAPSSRMVLKVIRNHPTEHYKWDHFPGVDAVLGKYRQLHEINRAGSMLDNVIYSNVRLPRAFFGDDLLQTLTKFASDNVAADGDDLIFKHLIVQMKMIPLPVFLETATREQAEQAIGSLGRCIKNNAAANIFNKDLDGRNYGVGQTLKVYLFDYDAVEKLTDVKVRSNADRIDGDEDIPDWFFEEGTIFLPEEIELHMRIEDPSLRRVFRAEHGEILKPEYWTQMQKHLELGEVPRVSTYPGHCTV